MTDPLTGPAAMAARVNGLSLRIAALTGDAIVPSGMAGAFTTAAQRTGGPTFAAILAESRAAGPATAGDVEPAVAAGGPAATGWTIPWLDGAAPAGPGPRGFAEAGAVGVTALEAAAAPALLATGLLATGAADAAAVDDPLAVVRPLKGRISQPFGPTDSIYSVPHTVDGVTYRHFHDGIDIAAPVGRPVRAIAAGRVIFAGVYPDGANVIRVRHADGSISLYAHLGEGYDVQKGDFVAAGQRLGVVGTSGPSTGPHLHLEVLVKGEDADPLPILERGRLPGRPSGRIDESVLGPTGIDARTRAALDQFDAVADRIPFAAEIRDAALRAGVDPLLLASLVRAESGFRPRAVSYAGAMGLCQLMPATARALGVEDPFDPVQNLRAGARYLARNLHIYGRVDLALAAYQAGKGAVAAAGGIPDSPTTRHYIKRILKAWAGYQEDAA